jgi:hypothetical protein
MTLLANFPLLALHTLSFARFSEVVAFILSSTHIFSSYHEHLVFRHCFFTLLIFALCSASFTEIVLTSSPLSSDWFVDLCTHILLYYILEALKKLQCYYLQLYMLTINV